jgi:acetyl-CoA carboxylase carboxyl transferase subunit alpha
MWKDGTRGAEAAEAMKITARDLLRFGIIDVVVPEPPGGAHLDPTAAAHSLQTALIAQLADLEDIPLEELLERRTHRYRNIGVFNE